MKIKVLILSCLVVLILTFTFTTRVSEIRSDAIDLTINSTLDDVSNELHIESDEMVSQINQIISQKMYFNQAYINTYSRDQMDYEVNLYEFDENGQMTKWYRLLVNIDANENISDKSRLDVIVIRNGASDFKKSHSLMLSEKQVLALRKIIESNLD